MRKKISNDKFEKLNKTPTIREKANQEGKMMLTYAKSIKLEQNNVVFKPNTERDGNITIFELKNINPVQIKISTLDVKYKKSVTVIMSK